MTADTATRTETDIDIDPRALYPDTDPRPELYTVGGSVPPDVMQRYGEWVGRNPTHPGADLATTLERLGLGVAEAAALYGVERAELDEVLAERAPITAELAVRMHAASGMRAILWMRQQIAYDIAIARRHHVSAGVITADAVHPDPLHEPDWDPESIPVLDEGADPATATGPDAEPAPAAALAS